MGDFVDRASLTGDSREMGDIVDHASLTGDWVPPNSCQRALFSHNVVSASIADSGAETKSRSVFSQLGDPDCDDQPCARVGGDEAIPLAEPQINTCESLKDRMTARAGFNALRVNIDNIRAADLSKPPEVRSPYLTIPPGLSPTTLLDSPIFVTNSMVLPSPTTGKFSFASTGNCLNSTLMTKELDNRCGVTNASSFAFKPLAESDPNCCFNTVNSSIISPHSNANHGVFVQPEASLVCPSEDPSHAHSQNNGTLLPQTNILKTYDSNYIGSIVSSGPSFNPVGVTEHSTPLDEPRMEDGDSNGGGGPCEDGYNWRKYGQKQVKRSEYPRSYYKCTHPNCTVKKKVERSEEGHITEIIYEGAHNHLKSPPNRRSISGSTNGFSDIQLDSEQPGTGANDALNWSAFQKGKPSRDWRQGNLETMSSSPLGQEYSTGASPMQAQMGQLELGDSVDGLSSFSNDGDDDDHATRVSVSLPYDIEGDESESKKRRIETCASDMGGATRAIREPRVVVQTTSEVDILDDGYRWRKYGQKVVKGNPNPRSYYKCTSPGCNVRKHVERASHDLKSVITTYEGKHNHEVPAARSNSHVNSSSLPNQQAPVAAPLSLVHRPQPSQFHNSTSRIERPFLGSFNRAQVGPGSRFGYGMNEPGLASLALAGLGPSPGRLPMLPVLPNLGNQSVSMNNNLGFLLPKGELKIEPATDSGLNPSNASAVYQQLLSQLPLGPQM